MPELIEVELRIDEEEAALIGKSKPDFFKITKILINLGFIVLILVLGISLMLLGCIFYVILKF